MRYPQQLSTALYWSCMILTSSVEASCFSLCLSASICHRPSPLEHCIDMFNLLSWAQWVKLAVLRIAQHTQLHNFCEVGESQILSVLRIARHFQLCNLREVSECSARSAMPPKIRPRGKAAAQAAAAPAAPLNLTIQLQGGEQDLQNVAYITTLTEAWALVSNHRNFSNVQQAIPLSLAEGCAQVPYKHPDYLLALSVGGNGGAASTGTHTQCKVYLRN